MTAPSNLLALQRRRSELHDRDDHIRDMIEQMILLDDLGYSALDRDTIDDMLNLKRSEVLRNLRDVEQELDHAWRR